MKRFDPLRSKPVESCFSGSIFFALFASLRETSLLFSWRARAVFPNPGAHHRGGSELRAAAGFFSQRRKEGPQRSPRTSCQETRNDGVAIPFGVVGYNVLSPRTPLRNNPAESCFPDKILFAVFASLRETSSLLCLVAAWPAAYLRPLGWSLLNGERTSQRTQRFAEARAFDQATQNLPLPNRS